MEWAAMEHFAEKVAIGDSLSLPRTLDCLKTLDASLFSNVGVTNSRLEAAQVQLEDDHDDFTSVVLPGQPPVPSGKAHEVGGEPMVFFKTRKVWSGRAKTLPANRLYMNKLKQLDVCVSMHKAHNVDLISQSCIMEGNFAATDFSSAILVLSLDTICKAAVRGDVL